MLYIRGHKIIKGYICNTPVSHVGFGKSGLIKIKSENGGSDYPDNLIAKYTTNTSGVLPIFNSGYQYTINETESNGVYTVELFSDDAFTSCSFSNKSELLTVEYLKVTSNIINMSAMFQQCSKLTQLALSNWDTSNVTNMSYMFQGCSSLTQLDLNNFDTSKVTSMNAMFRECSSLNHLNVSNFDTSKITSTQYMFYNCSNLLQLDLSNFDTSKITSTQYMFCNCSNLLQLDLSNFDTSKVTNTNYMFQQCTSLTDFIAPKNINANISFNHCNKLSHDSLMSIINNLTTVTTTQKLTIGATNLAKLSSEEKAIAINKGWTLA